MKSDLFSGEKSAPILDLKQVSEEGEFEGYASVFGERDQGDDVVLSGAFAESLQQRPADKIKLLWQHDTNEIIGKWLEVREDQRGLYCKGRLFMGVQRGREVHEVMKEGAVDGLSIGYRTLVDEFDRETGVRHLLKIDLREVSVVTFPMLESATVSLVKNGRYPTEREFERHLRDEGFSAREAKVINAKGFKSLQVERDAGMGDIGGVQSAVSELSRALRG